MKSKKQVALKYKSGSLAALFVKAVICIGRGCSKSDAKQQYNMI